jgi:hypothetical protein
MTLKMSKQIVLVLFLLSENKFLSKIDRNNDLLPSYARAYVPVIERKLLKKRIPLLDISKTREKEFDLYVISSYS